MGEILFFYFCSVYRYGYNILLRIQVFSTSILSYTWFGIVSCLLQWLAYTLYTLYIYVRYWTANGIWHLQRKPIIVLIRMLPHIPRFCFYFNKNVRKDNMAITGQPKRYLTVHRHTIQIPIDYCVVCAMYGLCTYSYIYTIQHNRDAGRPSVRIYRAYIPYMNRKWCDCMFCYTQWHQSYFEYMLYKCIYI